MQRRRKHGLAWWPWVLLAGAGLATPALASAAPPPESMRWLFELVPDAWQGRWAGLRSWQWFGLSFAILIGLPVGYGVGRILTSIGARVARRTVTLWDDILVDQTRSGIRFATAWLGFAIVIQNLGLPDKTGSWLEIVARTPLILAAGWMTRRVVRAITGIYLEQVPDPGAKRRGLRTQISILRRLSTVVIGLVTFSVVLLQFEVVRTVGLSLLASAGVAGVALGFAAKESLANVIAGLQLSISQTIRLGDVVAVEGQWARVEEIALTYVRLRLFDDRTLVVPVSRLLNNPFENWSRGDDGLIGIVEFAVDPSIPVDRVRQELQRIATAHKNHDGRECRLQLIDLDERRALLRARVSSRDLRETFQMRCDVREGLLSFLQELESGRYLARQRYERVDPADPVF